MYKPSFLISSLLVAVCNCTFYTDSLADCLAFAGLFNNTVTPLPGVPDAFARTYAATYAASDESMDCMDVGACYEGYPNGVCTWNRVL